MQKAIGFDAGLRAQAGNDMLDARLDPADVRRRGQKVEPQRRREEIGLQVNADERRADAVSRRGEAR
jgi:hypothetical protein